MPELSALPTQSGIFVPLVGGPRLPLPMDEVSVSDGFHSPAADYEDTARAKALMTTLDKINQRWGRRTLHIAAEGVQKAWQMKRSKLSPRYTTAWSELPKVWAK